MKTILAIQTLLIAIDCAFSAPRAFIKIESWEQTVNPPEGGSLYGPNWSIDEDLKPVSTEGKTGAMVWAIGDSPFIHPELRKDTPVGKWLATRPNLGISMSGGGQRAACNALGWYRALNHLGLLTKARYIGATSGGTWTTLPLFCRQMLQMKEKRTRIDYEAYVGKYSGKIDSEIDIKADGSIMDKILLEADILKHTHNTNATFNDWCDAIEQNYLQPIMSHDGFAVNEFMRDFWLDLSNAYLWNTKDNTVGNEKLLNEDSFPFPIFVATGYDSANKNQLFPIENTPLYSGIPVDPKKLGLKTEFGGGFIQGVALNSEKLENTDSVPVSNTATFIKEFKNPSPVVKVAELSGASSNFAAAGNAMVRLDLQNSWLLNMAFFLKFLFEDFKDMKEDVKGFLDSGKYKWWSPSSGGKSVELNFVDGGMFDNLGVLALLRRGCSTLIVCVSCDSDVVLTKANDVYANFNDVSSLFGLSKPYIPPWLLQAGFKNELNKRSQVFESEEFEILMDEMRKLRNENKPLVVRKKFELLVNEKAGIYESREVDMIFCFNSSLEPVKELHEMEQKGEFTFPYFSVYKCDYTDTEVRQLCDLSAYSLVEGLKNVGFDISQVGM